METSRRDGREEAIGNQATLILPAGVAEKNILEEERCLVLRRPQIFNGAKEPEKPDPKQVGNCEGLGLLGTAGKPGDVVEDETRDGPLALAGPVLLLPMPESTGEAVIGVTMTV
jgi:hypothetical protein